MRSQTVVAIDGAKARQRDRKAVAAKQKAIDALPLNSGTWRIEGERGLYLRARAATRSYFMQRRVQGSLVKTTIGEMSLKEAREEAARRWGLAEPKPAGAGKTFGCAFEEFLTDGGKRGELADKTRTNYRYNLDRYLPDWKGRALEDIGRDEDCGRVLYRRIRQKHGAATAAQVIRLVSAVYRHARKVNRRLPESPTVAVTLPPTKKRDWALSPEALTKWWRGVSTLVPIKKTWWLTALLTGARAGSIEALEWRDVDLSQKTILFRVTKGDRPYKIPMSDRLAEILTDYRDAEQAPPSRWVFPSPSKADAHVVAVRNDKQGVPSAHHMRHTYRTVLFELGATTDQARMLMGHSMGGDVSRSYITAGLVIESLRPITNAVSERLVGLAGVDL
jgi:integrase